jgi:outer membrane protein assembly factor BamB
MPLRAHHISFGALVSALILFVGNAAAQDWPQWRGPNRDAKATGFAAPATWPTELKKKWSVPVGDGVATPALVGNKLYVFTRQDGKEIFRCLDATTGDEAWQKSYEEEGTTGGASGFPGPRSSPTVADGKVVTFGVRGILSCYDTASGKELWRKEDFAESYPQFFTSSSPIVVDGLCIAQVGGRRDGGGGRRDFGRPGGGRPEGGRPEGERPEGGRPEGGRPEFGPRGGGRDAAPGEGGVLAYDLTSGEEKWRWMGSTPAYGSPVLMELGGKKVVFAPTDNKLVALSLDGKLLWEIPYSQGRYNASTPIVDGSTLVIAGPGTGFTAFEMKWDGDKLSEQKLWSNTDNSVGFNTPVLKNGLIFGLSNANQLFCFNTKDKSTTWSAPFSKEAPAAQEPGRAGVGQNNERGVAVTLVQFVQQEGKADEEKKDRPDDRPRGESGPRRGEGRGRFGPGGFGRGFGRGGGGMGGRGYGSIVDVGSALLGLTPVGELVVYQADGKAFNELARYKVAERGTYAYPVPSGHGIYVKDQDSLTLWTLE